MPLEGSTVRFIDNFSIGTRGSASAEYFLQQGYAVIFLHRARSLSPYTRHLPQHHLLDILEMVEDGGKTALKVKDEHTSHLLNTVQTYQQMTKEGRILQIDFSTLVDYLHLLRACSLILSRAGRNSMLYLAAAVSDFYIPRDKMPQHKIQSSDGPLQLSLELVPKMLEALVKNWIKQAFIVSFKLETDPSLLIGKATQALEKYQHQIVIGNILHTRETEVCMVTQEEQNWIRLNKEEISSGVEIESKIVQYLTDVHSKFLEQDK